jgi:hypothetical protein
VDRESPGVKVGASGHARDEANPAVDKDARTRLCIMHRVILSQVWECMTACCRYDGQELKDNTVLVRLVVSG